MHTEGWCLMQAVKPIWDPGCMLKQLTHAEFNAAMATPQPAPKPSPNADPWCPGGCNVTEAQHLLCTHHLQGKIQEGGDILIAGAQDQLNCSQSSCNSRGIRRT